MDHDLVVLATIPITEKEARLALRGDTLWIRNAGHGPNPDAGTGVRDSVFICFTCEQVLSEELLRTECPGEPD